MGLEAVLIMDSEYGIKAGSKATSLDEDSDIDAEPLKGIVVKRIPHCRK